MNTSALDIKKKAVDYSKYSLRLSNDERAKSLDKYYAFQAGAKWMKNEMRRHI